MAPPHFITKASTLALICAAGPAFADVTPQEVWDDMVKSYGVFGIEVDGRISEDGATLTAEDIVFRVTIPEDMTGENETATFELTSTGWQFVDNGDGTVSIVLPETTPIGMRGTDKIGEALNVSMEMTGENQEYPVSGDPDSMTTAYSAGRLTVKVVEAISEGEAVPDMDVVYNMLIDIKIITRGHQKLTAPGRSTDSVVLSELLRRLSVHYPRKSLHRLQTLSAQARR